MPRRLPMIALPVAALSLAGGFLPLPAQAAALNPRPAAPNTAAARAGSALQRGAITGIIARPGGVLSGACVTASGTSGTARAFTDATGRYLLTVRPGSYTLHASDCSAAGTYLDRWSGNAASPALARQVTVTAGQITTTTRITLQPASTQGGGAWIGSGASAFPVTGWTGTHSWAITPAGSQVAIGSWAGAKPLTRAKQAAPASQAAGTGAISGTVTGNGVPVADICVATYGRGRLHLARTTTTGAYQIKGLRPGKYQVHFAECGHTTANWLPQWYPDLTSIILRHPPARVKVAAGKTTTGIDAALKLGGQIGGTVRSTSGKVLSGFCVDGFGQVGQFGAGFGMVSASNGRYVLHSIFPGVYRVGFFRYCGNKGNYAPQWWRDKPTEKAATKISIKSGTIAANIDAAVLRGGVIAGVVTGARPDGPKLAGVCVSAQALTPGAAFSTTVTTKTGSYRLIGLTTSRYTLRFSRCRNRGNYLSGKRKAHATLGEVTRAVNIFLRPGAVMSGTVTNTHGDPVGRACVQLRGTHHTADTRTASDGSYSVNALPADSYSVQFAGGCGNAGSYASQFYNGQTNSASATPVQLTAGHTTQGIDATLQPGATITGTVTDAQGHKLSRVCVELSPPDEPGGEFVIGGIAITKNGSYTERNLNPGQYDVEFNCFGQFSLARLWFSSQLDADVADSVSAAGGVITSGVSAVLPTGGEMTGTVTNRSGKDVQGVCVTALPAGAAVPDPFDSFVSGYTNRLGAYTIRDIAPGKYSVQFIDCRTSTYGSQWYSGARTENSATPVTIRPGATTSGIGAVVRPGGSISGTVTGPVPPGPKFPRCVTASDSATGSFGRSGVLRDGRYVIGGLSGGSYRISVASCFFIIPIQAGVSIGRPGTVTVTAPHPITGINIKTGPTGTISGTVLGGPSATPLAGVCVQALAANSGDTYAEGMTGAGGTYTLSGVPAGQYQVYFGDPSCLSLFIPQLNVAPQWYNGQQSRATAADVTVTAGATTSGIGATLGADGTISGTVTANTAGLPAVAGECVTAFPFHPVPDPVDGATITPSVAVTGHAGRYILTSLVPGQYRIGFTTGCGDAGYQTQWWKHASSAAATVITVTADATITGIGAVLHPTG